jgi:hypothetical protein
VEGKLVPESITGLFDEVKNVVWRSAMGVAHGLPEPLRTEYLVLLVRELRPAVCISNQQIARAQLADAHAILARGVKAEKKPALRQFFKAIGPDYDRPWM